MPADKEAAHMRFYAAFHAWFMSEDNGCDFWSECDAPEALATIAVEIADQERVVSAPAAPDTPTPERDAEWLAEIDEKFRRWTANEGGYMLSHADGLFLRHQLDARDAALREREAALSAYRADVERLTGLLHRFAIPPECSADCADHECPYVHQWTARPAEELAPRDAAPAQPGAEHVQRAREVVAEWQCLVEPEGWLDEEMTDLQKCVAAGLAAAEQRGYARAREDAAHWHESQRPALSGAEYGLSSEAERRSLRLLDRWHLEAIEAIRALSPAEGEPR